MWVGGVLLSFGRVGGVRLLVVFVGGDVLFRVLMWFIVSWF